jgi:hypothetical protein
MNDERVYWWECDCPVTTKYCEENHLASATVGELKAEALEEFAALVYNGAPAEPDANFQAFYNYGLNPVLMQRAAEYRSGERT